jgi:hypothetical protein
VILIELDISMKLVSLINVYVNETCGKVRVGKHLSDMLPIREENPKKNVRAKQGKRYMAHKN